MPDEVQARIWGKGDRAELEPPFCSSDPSPATLRRVHLSRLNSTGPLNLKPLQVRAIGAREVSHDRTPFVFSDLRPVAYHRPESPQGDAHARSVDDSGDLHRGALIAAVTTSGRPSMRPRSCQTFWFSGDWRRMNVRPDFDQGRTLSVWLSRTNSPRSVTTVSTA